MKTPGRTLYDAFFASTNGSECVPSGERCEAAAQVLLASQWRPVSEPPEDKTSKVLHMFSDRSVGFFRFGQPVPCNMALWAPIPPLPAPPWKLPDPPPGREWHRSDWTQEMLPDGWRPLLEMEVVKSGDEYLFSDVKWILDTTCVDCIVRFGWAHRRTRRPLPPSPEEESRAEFDRWWSESNYASASWRDICFSAWSAAREGRKTP